MNNPSPSRYPSSYRDRQVRAKSREVVDYHYDEQKPGKPLWLLIPGAMVALASLVLIVFLVYQTYGAETLDKGFGTPLILALAPFYVGGVFVFSYGYELYDLGKAIRLTAIIVFVTLAAIFMFAVLLVVLGALGKGSKSRSSSSGGGSPSGGASNSGGSFRGGGPLFLGNTLPNITINRETVREVPVAPPAPEPVACAHCNRPYLPAENKFACPNCGAPMARETI